MHIDELRAKLDPVLQHLDALDGDGVLAAPVDLDFMFHDDQIDDRPDIEAKNATIADGERVVVMGNVRVKHLEMHGHAMLVVGNVSAESIDLDGTMLVLGTLEVDGDIRGSNEPHTLTVMGSVAIGRAIMRRQYIMQFLGGGSIGTLIDDEGAGEELLELLRGAGSELEVNAVSASDER